MFRVAIPSALDFACAGAALNCTKMGARGGLATLSEVSQLMTKASRHANPAYRG